MKTNKYLILVSVLFFGVFSCNEEEWLEEEAYGFYTASNSYTTEDQFEAAIAKVYQETDQYSRWSNNANLFISFYTSDIAFGANRQNINLNNYGDQLVPGNGQVRLNWQRYYDVISSANTILGRIDLDGTEFTSEAKRTAIKAEASFFRGYLYNYLATQYGGVPLVLEEVTSAKRDFVRATQAEVYAQCVIDLEYAAANLPDVTELGDEVRLTSAAANHLLAELYITVGEYDKAIASATAVIDNPSYQLMTERFGSRMDEPGDVYWDLFRRENQNRSSGNTEAIWVSQYEYLVPGGGNGSTITQFLGPEYYKLVGPDGSNLMLGPTTQNGGRGISWIAASDYLLNDVWADSPGDMRNSDYNIIRDIVADNVNSPYFGQKVVENDLIANDNSLSKIWSAIFSKTTVANNFPEELFVDEATGEVTRNASQTFRDHYQMRLAETYLLRAEAYVMSNQPSLAAADINKLRDRANAPLVSASDVDLDYILDERARELHFEEFRTLTLKRTGKLIERVRTNNPWYNGKFSAYGVSIIEDYHALWPIPSQEIERNAAVVLEQNPGYAN